MSDSKFLKRIQSRLSNKNINLSYEQIRPVYLDNVSNPDSPTDTELAIITGKLFAAHSQIAITETEGKISMRLEQPISETKNDVPETGALTPTQQNRFSIIQSQAEMLDLSISNVEMEEIARRIEAPLTDVISQEFRLCSDAIKAFITQRKNEAINQIVEESRLLNEFVIKETSEIKQAAAQGLANIRQIDEHNREWFRGLREAVQKSYAVDKVTN